MPEPRISVDRALDLLVYGPLGLALSAREAVPSFVAKGREQLTPRLTMARLVGQFTVNQRHRQLNEALGRARDQARQTFERRAAGGDEPDVPVVGAGRRAPVTAERPASTPTSGPAAEQLAIPDYDSLSASQVLPRLEGLRDEELEAVRAYEAAHRGRKTILGRIAQLQS